MVKSGIKELSCFTDNLLIAVGQTKKRVYIGFW